MLFPAKNILSQTAVSIVNAEVGNTVTVILSWQELMPLFTVT